MWNTHSSLFLFYVAPFRDPLLLTCYFASWRAQEARRRYEGYKDQHRQRASLVSTDGAKVGESFNAAKENGLGWKEVKEKVKVRPFFTPFWPFWWKFGESWWKFGESLVKTFVRIRREGGGLLKRIRWSLPKKQDATPAPPRLGPTNSPPARHRFTGPYTVWSSCHHVIMP